MKRGTPRHKKMHALASALGVRLYSAVGIMEMLWHYAGQHTPEGDIGSVPDVEIASAVSWEKKPDKLVKALVESHWLERHEDYRLYIHDWPDHCEQSVRKWLDRNRKNFLPVYGHHPDSVRTNAGQVIDGVQASRGHGLAGQGSEGSEEKKDGNAGDLVETIALWIQQYGAAMKVHLAPDPGACQRICMAMLQAGKNLDDLQEVFRDLYEEKSKPKGTGWIISVLEARLAKVSHATQ